MWVCGVKLRVRINVVSSVGARFRWSHLRLAVPLKGWPRIKHALHILTPRHDPKRPLLPIRDSRSPLVMPYEFSGVVAGVPHYAATVEGGTAVAADYDLLGLTVPGEVGDGTAKDLDFELCGVVWCGVWGLGIEDGVLVGSRLRLIINYCVSLRGSPCSSYPQCC